MLIVDLFHSRYAITKNPCGFPYKITIFSKRQAYINHPAFRSKYIALIINDTFRGQPLDCCCMLCLVCSNNKRTAENHSHMWMKSHTLRVCIVGNPQKNHHPPHIKKSSMGFRHLPRFTSFRLICHVLLMSS